MSNKGKRRKIGRETYKDYEMNILMVCVLSLSVTSSHSYLHATRGANVRTMNRGIDGGENDVKEAAHNSVAPCISEGTIVTRREVRNTRRKAGPLLVASSTSSLYREN